LVAGAGPLGTNLIGTIESVTSSTSVVLYYNTGTCGTTVSGATVSFGEVQGTSSVEPSWPGSPSVGSTFTDSDPDGPNTWIYMGPQAQYSYSKRVDTGLRQVFEQQAQTTTATSTPVATFQLQRGALVPGSPTTSQGAMTLVTVDVVAFEVSGTSAPDGATFSLAGGWYFPAAGSAVQVRAPVVTSSSPNATGTPWSAVLTVNAAAGVVDVKVTGDTGKIITWVASIVAVQSSIPAPLTS
jgi:hypothetical protein